MFLPEAKFRRETKAWDKKTGLETLQGGQIPKSLTNPAKGRFGALDFLINKTRGIEIPRYWQVRDMLAALAVATAFLLIKKQSGEEGESLTAVKPEEVTFIIDPYDQRKLPTTIDCRVKIGNAVVCSSVHTPSEFEHQANLFGFPSKAYVNGTGSVSLEVNDFFDGRGLTPTGMDLLNTVTDLILSVEGTGK